MVLVPGTDGKMSIDLNTQGARLLAEIGFLGLSRGVPQHSEVVFAALTRLRPGEEAGHIGLAMARLAADDAKGAVQVLSRARQSETVIAFACLAHARLGDREMAQELRDELVDMGAPQALREIADGALTGA
jgi:hypothetical protein